MSKCDPGGPPKTARFRARGGGPPPRAFAILAVFFGRADLEQTGGFGKKSVQMRLATMNKNGPHEDQTTEMFLILHKSLHFLHSSHI